MSDKRIVIAIDGPAGAGKSTLAKRIAVRLGYVYISTGALYRAVALWALRLGTELTDMYRLTQLAKEAKIELLSVSGHVLLNGEDVTEAIRVPEVSDAASRISALPGVRRALLPGSKPFSKRTTWLWRDGTAPWRDTAFTGAGAGRTAPLGWRNVPAFTAPTTRARFAPRSPHTQAHRHFPQNMPFVVKICGGGGADAGDFEGEKSMAKRRNGESRPERAAGSGPAIQPTAMSGTRTSSTTARWIACSRRPRRGGTASAITC